jgi:hypothetical protein
MRIKSAAFLLLILLFFITAGYHFLFKIQIAEAKTEMKSRMLQISDDALVKMEFDATQLSSLDWENDSEFTLNGEMYDVVENHTENGKTTILCLPDGKETALVAAYQQVQKNNPNEKNTSNIFFKLITAPFLPSSMVKFQNIPRDTKNRFISNSSQLLTSIRRILTPPPRVC